MLIKLNTKSNFKLVDEGEQVLEITKAECTPSGKPDKLKVSFAAESGGNIMTTYTLNPKDNFYWLSGFFIATVLELEDGDSFDTKDVSKMVGKKVLCEVVHTKGTRANDRGELPTFANIKKIISLVKDEDSSPRNSIINNIDDMDDLD